MTSEYRGRFAPTPSGDLHFGSLVCALGSYLRAKAAGGKWLVRIDDVDTPRVVPGSSDRILRALEAHGLEWDEAVVCQSRQYPLYREAKAGLWEKGHLYRCDCTRKKIAAKALRGAEGPVYPGCCAARQEPPAEGAIRARTEGLTLSWEDGLQGKQTRDFSADFGDYVVWRRDRVCSYHLATAVDDFESGITEVVRGADLVFSTYRQIHLQEALGLPRPAYLHLPLALLATGEKLSKQTGATALDPDHAGLSLVRALRFLGHAPPRELESTPAETVLGWALANWSLSSVPQALGYPFEIDEPAAAGPSPPMAQVANL